MIESNKYSLSLLTEKESKSFFVLIQNNIKRLEDFFAGTVSKTKTQESTQAYCKEIERRTALKEYYPYLIIENKTNVPVGLIDVKNIDWEIPKGEIGAFIDSNVEGKGVVTILAKDLINQIVKEHQFKKIFCRVSAQNERSIRLVARLGFILEGTLRREYKTTKGELVDLNYYGCLFD